MKLTAEQVERLNSLETAKGGLLPSVVIEDAKLKDSPLHGLFEWNIKKAAAIQWIQRAREIIGAVQIVVTTNEATVRAPMYVRDPEAKGEGYRSVVSLRNDPVNARESLIYTLDVAAGHIRRAQDLAQSLDLAGEIDQLLAQIVGVQRLIQRAA
jgi:hypothetical protein